MGTNDWVELFDRVQSKETGFASWTSDKISLSKIIQWADIHGVTSEGVLAISISNLRTIIPALKKAMRKQDKRRFEELFYWAKTMTVIDLRHHVGISEPEVVNFTRHEEDGFMWCIAKVTSEQLDRIKNSTKSFLIWEEEK